MRSSSKTALILILVILLVAYGKTLKLSFSGDDWGAFFYFKSHFANITSIFNLSNYMGNYDGPQILMGLISKFFDYNPTAYYALSILLKYLATASLFFMVKSITKNINASIIAAFLFASMYVGVESSNWVFNMATYLSLMLLNLFILIVWKNRFKFEFKEEILSTILFFFALYFSPHRLHGLIATLPLFIFVMHKAKDAKRALFKTVIYILPFIIFRAKTGQVWDISYISMITEIFSIPFKNYLYPIYYIGAPVIPSELLGKILGQSISNIFVYASGFVYLLAIPIILFNKLRYKNSFLIALFFYLSSILLTLIPWAIFHTVSFDLSSRYLTVPGFFILTCISLVLTEVFEKKSQRLVLYIFIVITTLANIYQINIYFNKLLESGRSQQMTDIIFNSIKTASPSLDSENPSIFVFETQDKSINLHEAVRFGFSYKVLMYYPELRLNHNIRPVVVENSEIVKRFFEGDMETIKRYGYDEFTFKTNNVYYFDITRNGALDVSNEFRKNFRR